MTYVYNAILVHQAFNNLERSDDEREISFKTRLNIKDP